MEHGGEDPAHQIEHHEAHVPHGVLDVVAEHPQEQHVAEQMDPAAVQEHVADQGEALRHERAGGEHRALLGTAGHQLGRDDGERGSVLRIERNDPAGLEDRKDGDVEGDQRHRHILKADALQRVGVMEGYEHGYTVTASAVLARHPGDVALALVVGGTGRDEQKIRQPIDIAQSRLAYRLALPRGQRHDQALGAP